MNFWDTSALVAFHLGEHPVGALKAILENDSGVAIWWGAQVEFASAISRREREGFRLLAGSRKVAPPAGESG